MANSSDVLIAGGGIIGCSIAYHLAQLGIKSTIIERESIGSQASGAATGLLVALKEAGAPEPFTRLIEESCKRHKEIIPEVEELSKIDAQYGDFAWTEIACSDAEVSDLKEAFSEVLSGPAASWLSESDLRELESRVTQDAIGGIYIGGQAQVDAYRLTLAFAQAAEALGVTIRYGEVTGLRTEAGRVKGLDTSLGPIDSDTVVLAIGSWSKRIEEWIGMDVPVEPLKGQTIHVEIPGDPLPCMIHHVDRYVAPKKGGTVITGTYDGFMGFDTSIHEQGIAKISEGVLSLCPGILESKVVSHVTGLRPASADWLPILGAVPSIEGAYIATGHQRLGITLSAITGEVMSQLINDGKPRLDLHPFRLDRFEGVTMEMARDRFGAVH